MSADTHREREQEEPDIIDLDAERFARMHGEQVINDVLGNVSEIVECICGRNSRGLRIIANSHALVEDSEYGPPLRAVLFRLADEVQRNPHKELIPLHPAQRDMADAIYRELRRVAAESPGYDPDAVHIRYPLSQCLENIPKTPRSDCPEPDEAN